MHAIITVFTFIIITMNYILYYVRFIIKHNL